MRFDWGRGRFSDRRGLNKPLALHFFHEGGGLSPQSPWFRQRTGLLRLPYLSDEMNEKNYVRWVIEYDQEGMIHGVADLIPVHPFTPTGSFYRTTIECPMKAVYQCDVTI